MTLTKFISKWNGNKADYDNAYGGECVDLYNFYMRDVLSLNPYKFGAVSGAKDLSKNLKQYAELDWIPKSSGKMPKKGDIIIFDGTIGGGFGHVGIVLEATPHKIVVFDQIGSENDLLERPPAKRTYTKLWPAVIGWATPKENTMDTAFKDLDKGYSLYKSIVRKYRNGRIPTDLNYDQYKRKYQHWSPYKLISTMLTTEQKRTSKLRETLQELKDQPPEVIVKEVEKIVEKEVVVDNTPSILKSIENLLKAIAAKFGINI